MSLDDHGALDGEFECRYAPSPHAHCHVCGQWVRLTGKKLMYRHRPSDMSDWCIGSRERVGAVIKGFLGPYVRDPRPMTAASEGFDVKIAVDPAVPGAHAIIIDHKEARPRVLGESMQRQFDAYYAVTKAWLAAPKESTMKTFDQMSPDELRPFADRFRAKHHFVPDSSQLRKFVEDEVWYVQCTFSGTSHTAYTYRVNPGEPVSVGDYLQVWSPMTDRLELVRVAALGRGSWSGYTKTAQRVSVEALD